jgi:hypothetical protein
MSFSTIPIALETQCRSLITIEQTHRLELDQRNGCYLFSEGLNFATIYNNGHKETVHSPYYSTIDKTYQFTVVSFFSTLSSIIYLPLLETARIEEFSKYYPEPLNDYRNARLIEVKNPNSFTLGVLIRIAQYCVTLPDLSSLNEEIQELHVTQSVINKRNISIELTTQFTQLVQNTLSYCSNQFDPTVLQNQIIDFTATATTLLDCLLSDPMANRKEYTLSNEGYLNIQDILILNGFMNSDNYRSMATTPDRYKNRKTNSEFFNALEG